MRIKEIKHYESFEKELNDLDKEMAEIESLYSDGKVLYEEIKASTGRGRLTFLDKQLANLINLKKTKRDLIKDKVDIKKIITDFDFKDKGIGDNGDGIKVNQSLLNIINEHNKFDKESITIANTPLNEDDIDAKLAKIAEEEGLIKDTIASTRTSDELSAEALVKVDEEENKEIIISEETITSEDTLEGTVLISDEIGIVYECNINGDELNIINTRDDIDIAKLDLDNKVAYDTEGNKYPIVAN